MCGSVQGGAPSFGREVGWSAAQGGFWPPGRGWACSSARRRPILERWHRFAAAGVGNRLVWSVFGARGRAAQRFCSKMTCVLRASGCGLFRLRDGHQVDDSGHRRLHERVGHHMQVRDSGMVCANRLAGARAVVARVRPMMAACCPSLTSYRSGHLPPQPSASQHYSCNILLVTVGWPASPARSSF